MPSDPPAPRVGRFPLAAFCAGLGLLICSIANALSRSTETTTTLVYWAGLLLIVLPIFYRLTSKDASPRERLALVCLLGLSLYGVKVVRDSLLFTFPDEFVHAYSAHQIVEHHHLFQSNLLLPATPRYPGLEGATSALMTLTGMSSFGAGIVVIGVARLVFVMSLFFLFARLGGSARLAGLGVAVYTGSSNFLYWGAQFSYESLALPLLVLVLMAFVEREKAPRSWRVAWLVPIVLGIVAVVLTHHMTSYAMVVILTALAVAYRLMKVPKPNPWPLAVFAFVVTAGWLLFKAETTIGYLFPVLENAIEATINTASGESAPRTLFHASKTGVATATTPWFARLVSLGAIALLGIAMLFGLREVARRRRNEPLAVIFSLAALCFFGALALRFAPAAWETGNRAGEFLFLGLAFVIACAAVWALETRQTESSRRAAITCGLARGPRRRSDLRLAMGLPARQADSRPRRGQGNRLGAARAGAVGLGAPARSPLRSPRSRRTPALHSRQPRRLYRPGAGHRRHRRGTRLSLLAAPDPPQPESALRRRRPQADRQGQRARLLLHGARLRRQPPSSRGRRP